MKRLLIGLCFVMVLSVPALANMTAIGLQQATDGRYQIEIPTVMSIGETPFVATVNPILTSIDQNAWNMGYKLSRVKATVGMAFYLFGGVMKVDSGLSYWAADNREGINETMKAILESKWVRSW